MSSVTDIEFEHISCLSVKNHNKIIVGGRWFGIYICEKDESDSTIVTKHKLVDASRLKKSFIKF